MKTLLLLRHAKSSWNNSRLSDHERPLNARGRRDAPRMGQLLRLEGLVPDLILSSTAERALATAEAVAGASGYGTEIRLSRNLYHADADAVLEELRELDDAVQRVMVVGHNPGLSELLLLLTEMPEYMPTAALAQIDLPVGRWAQVDEGVRGRLVNFWVPRELAP